MRRGSISLALSASLVMAVLLPVSASAAKPTANVSIAGGCAAAVYSWSAQKNVVAAHLEIRPDGRLDATYTVRGVGASGSISLPADFYTFTDGQHYTIFGLLTDSRGRGINTSGAAWWGYCS